MSVTSKLTNFFLKKARLDKRAARSLSSTLVNGLKEGRELTDKELNQEVSNLMKYSEEKMSQGFKNGVAKGNHGAKPNTPEALYEDLLSKTKIQSGAYDGRTAGDYLYNSANDEVVRYSTEKLASEKFGAGFSRAWRDSDIGDALKAEGVSAADSRKIYRNLRGNFNGLDFTTEQLNENLDNIASLIRGSKQGNLGAHKDTLDKWGTFKDTKLDGMIGLNPKERQAILKTRQEARLKEEVAKARQSNLKDFESTLDDNINTAAIESGKNLDETEIEWLKKNRAGQFQESLIRTQNATKGYDEKIRKITGKFSDELTSADLDALTEAQRKQVQGLQSNINNAWKNHGDFIKNMDYNLGTMDYIRAHGYDKAAAGVGTLGFAGSVAFGGHKSNAELYSNPF